MRTTVGIALGSMALLAILVIGGLVPMSGHAPGAAPAPTIRTAPTGPAAPAAGPAISVAPSAAPAGASTPATPAPSDQTCPTPTGTPIWNVASFFADAVVSFYVPGDSSLDGSRFNTVPCPNVIPTYTNGFYMNVTTNVPLLYANVTIWGVAWPVPGNPHPDIPNFGPSAPKTLPMELIAPSYHQATFYFDIYRFFWPGSQVYFNITLATDAATPGIIRSTESSHSDAIPFPGGTNNATWEFYVADPWGAGSLQSSDASFASVVSVTTSPSVLTSPAFDPNPKQPIQIYLHAINPSGGPALPLPEAQVTLTLTGGSTGGGVYYENFGPYNHSTLHLPAALGPYPGTEVQFNITAWLPWEESANGQVGAIDRIYSPVYRFNWTSNGGWWQPASGLLANVALTSAPDVTSTGNAGTILNTGTPVNLTIHSPIENVTISAASVQFHYTDPTGSAAGTVALNAINANTSWVVLPGLPPQSTMTFSITAKDVFGNPTSSGNYSYSETGPSATPPPGGYGLFYVEAIDLSTGHLIPRVNYTIANNTWSETGIASIYGFLAPIALGGIGYLNVADGAYTVTIGAFGESESYTFTVATANPFTVVFYFASKPLPNDQTISTPPSVALPAVLGLVGATVAAWPISNWFGERRRKHDAEQRRITL